MSSTLRIVVTGSECTGKTTLAEALSKHYGTVVVPELARIFVEEQGRAPELTDVETIAQGQLDLEKRLTPEAKGILILDTDLLSSVVYSRHYYGDCPVWVEKRLLEGPGDLYLLCDIDVPWSPDGAQRDRGDRRESMQDLFRTALADRGLEFVEIRGSLSDRVDRAIRAIDDKLVEAR